MLNKINENIDKPVMSIIGGSKVSTKIDLLKSLVQKVDYLVIGGAMANTFLVSNGFKCRAANPTINWGSDSYGPYIYMAWGDVPFKYNNTF